MPFVAFSQLSYRIDAIQGGGYYLVEILQDTAKGTITEAPQRFNTPEQLTAYVGYLRELADTGEATAEKLVKDAEAEAKKILEKANADAKKEKEIVPLRRAAATKIEALAAAYFNPNKEVPKVEATPPKKPKKGKKQ